jgi:large subunit ribosomal protein L30
MAQNSKKLKITLIGSKFGRKANHAECVKGLGLRRMHHSVVIENTPANRGMIDKVIYLLQVEEI